MAGLRGVTMGIFGLLSVLVLNECAKAQNNDNDKEDISQKIGQLAATNGRQYIGPATVAFGANLNSGFFHTADVHDLFGFDIGVVGMFARIPDDKLTYRPVLDSIRFGGYTFRAGTDYEVPQRTATVFGAKKKDPVVAKQTVGTVHAGDTIFSFPGGIDFKYFPLVAPQLNVGLPVGTEFSLRYFPSTKLSKDVGKIQLVGFGFRHSISQWLNTPSISGSPEREAFPFNLSFGFMYQKFTLKDTAGGDFINTKVFTLGAQASKKFFILTLYGGLAYETANTNIQYTYTPSSGTPTTVRLDDLKGDNNFRANLGFSLHLLLLDIYADYSLASQPVITAGAALTFR
jgi:hypothetical protein